MSIGLKYKNNEKILEECVVADVPYLKFPLFSDTGLVNHGISTRLGGVSEGIYSSMNLSFARGDLHDSVMENYNRISRAIGTSPDKMVCSSQTHTTNIRVVTLDDLGKGVTREKDYTDVDGLITNIPGVCLVTFYADCVPMLFLDPVKKVIASSHSGWRGTVGRMAEVTIKKMNSEFGCKAKDILVAIGPSICQDCYEVSEDVIIEFKKSFDSSDYNRLFYKKENGKYQLNLWEANACILRDIGILPEHTAITNLCTCCNPELLFSHRASQGKRGNLAAFLALKEE